MSFQTCKAFVHLQNTNYDIFTFTFYRWALTMVIPLLSMQGQKALIFHQKYINLCSRWTKVLLVRNDMSVSNDRIFFFC